MKQSADTLPERITVSQTISVPVGSVNHALLGGLTAHAEGLEGVASAKLAGGHMKVVVAAGFDEATVLANLRAAGFR